MGEWQGMEDITPGLLETIQDEFDAEIKKSAVVQRVGDKIASGTATYADADDYAVEVGGILSKIYAKNLSSAVLPDGKMYYNIADRLITQMLERAYSMVESTAEEVQKVLNKRAGIGINAIKAPMNDSRIMGIVNVVASADKFDDAAHMLGEPVINFAQSVVADSIKRNVEFHGKAGLTPTVKRITVNNCCEWCNSLAGTYRYPKVPEDVYRRHRFCRCMVLYDPGDGSKQNVYTKKEISSDELARIERRKHIGSYKYQNVTAEYFGKARPAQGQVIYQTGYDKARHKNEVNMAEKLHDKFGGDITLLDETRQLSVKTPDYIWNKKLWELKTATTEKAADTAIRKGLKQIAANPGGIIIDYRDAKISIDKFEIIMDARMKRSNQETVDIMVILKNDKIKVYRYKK